MTKEALFAPIRESYDELKQALKGNDIDKITPLYKFLINSFVLDTDVSRL